MLFPEETFCIDQGADQAFTEVSIKIMLECLTLIWQDIEPGKRVPHPIFVGGLVAADNYFDHAISPCIISTRDSRANAACQHFEGEGYCEIRFFYHTPKSS